MKKNLFNFVLIFIVTISLSGCGSKTSVSSSKNVPVTYHELNFNIPDYFNKSEEYSGDALMYDWDDLGGKNMNSCFLNVNASTDYGNSHTEMIKSELEEGYGAENIEPTIKTINGVDWTIGTYTKSKTTFYRYFASYNGKLYVISYDDIGSGEVCKEAFDIISSSLKFN